MSNCKNVFSVHVVLNKFKEGHITLEEATQLIEDIYEKQTVYIPTCPPYPIYSYKTTTIPDYTVTCSAEQK